MNKTFTFNRTHYTVSITYHELHCAVYISQFVCILYTNVTLATHYNEFHVAKQPHITFLSCDFYIDTSRCPRPNERNGQHFHFVSRQQMERDIWINRFVEHGFLDGNYYGTSIDSIHNVINSGKTLLTLLPQVSEIGDDVMLM